MRGDMNVSTPVSQSRDRELRDPARALDRRDLVDVSLLTVTGTFRGSRQIHTWIHDQHPLVRLEERGLKASVLSGRWPLSNKKQFIASHRRQSENRVRILPVQVLGMRHTPRAITSRVDLPSRASGTVVRGRVATPSAPL